MTTVSKSQAAKLNPLLRNPSRWLTYSNEIVGIRLSFPKLFNRLEEETGNGYLLVPAFIKNDQVTDLLRYEIPEET